LHATIVGVVCFQASTPPFGYEAERLLVVGIASSPHQPFMAF
jgi:hypothetical protein